MTYALYTQSFGLSAANSPVVITNSSSGLPATLLTSPTGGVLNSTGRATLDSSGNLSVTLDTSQTWTVTPINPLGIGSPRPVISIARSSAQLLGTPLASDIAAGPNAQFIDVNAPALVYRLNGTNTQYVPELVATTPTVTIQPPLLRLDNTTHEGAALWFDFDEVSGSTTVTDKRSGMSGTLQGATPANAWTHALGYTGNGTDQYIPLTAGALGGVTALAQDIGNLSTLVTDGSMLLFVALLEHPVNVASAGCLISYGLSTDDTGAANHLGGWAIYLGSGSSRLQFQLKSPGASAGAIAIYTGNYDGLAGHGSGTNTRTAVACEIRASTVPGYLEMWSYQITINDPGTVLQQNNGTVTFPILSGGFLTPTGWTINTPGTYAVPPIITLPPPATPQGVQARGHVRLNNSGGIDYFFMDDPGSGYTAAQMPLPVTITNAPGDTSIGGGSISLSTSLVGGQVTGPSTANVTSPFTIGAWYGHNVSTPLAGSYLPAGVSIQKLGLARVPNQYGLGYQCCMNLRDNPSARPSALAY